MSGGSVPAADGFCGRAGGKEVADQPENKLQQLKKTTLTSYFPTKQKGQAGFSDARFATRINIQHRLRLDTRYA